MPTYMENTSDWACRLRFSGGREHVYVGCLESWNIPIGEDDTRSGRYGFSIGNGHTGGNLGRENALKIE